MDQPRTRAWPIGTPPSVPREGTVGSVMSRPLVTIDAGVSLEQAVALMEAHAIHHLLVTDRDRIVAVASDRDLQRGLGIGPAHRDDDRHRRRPLFQVAHYRIVTVDADASLADAARHLLEHNVSALPVVATQDDGAEAIVGIVTSRDLLRHLAASTEPRDTANLPSSRGDITARPAA